MSGVMVTVNNSGPDEAKERRRRQIRAEAIDALLQLRWEQAPVSDQEIAWARKADRP